MTKSYVDTELEKKADIEDVFGGDYNDLINTPNIPTVPTNLSAFINDTGYITAQQAPVLSVNGQTGNVIIAAGGGGSSVETDSEFTDAPSNLYNTQVNSGYDEFVLSVEPGEMYKYKVSGEHTKIQIDLTGKVTDSWRVMLDIDLSEVLQNYNLASHCKSYGFPVVLHAGSSISFFALDFNNVSCAKNRYIIQYSSSGNQSSAYLKTADNIDIFSLTFFNNGSSLTSSYRGTNTILFSKLKNTNHYAIPFSSDYDIITRNGLDYALPLTVNNAFYDDDSGFSYFDYFDWYNGGSVFPLTSKSGVVDFKVNTDITYMRGLFSGLRNRHFKMYVSNPYNYTIYWDDSESISTDGKQFFELEDKVYYNSDTNEYLHKIYIDGELKHEFTLS